MVRNMLALFLGIFITTGAAYGQADAKGLGNVTQYTQRFTLGLDQPPIKIEGPWPNGAIEPNPPAGYTLNPVIVGSADSTNHVRVFDIDTVGRLYIRTMHEAGGNTGTSSIFLGGAQRISDNAVFALNFDATDTTAVIFHDPDIGYITDAAPAEGATGSVNGKLRAVTGQIGDTTDTATTEGAAGTVSAKLRALTGQHGDTTDAAATAGGTGTESAKLRVMSGALGSFTDANITSDNTGSINGHLRGTLYSIGFRGDTFAAGSILGYENGIYGSTGAQSDAAATTDTGDASIIALLKRLNVHQTGAPTVTSGQQSVGAAATSITGGAGSTRRGVTLKNMDAAITVFVGPNTGLNTSTGFPLGPGESVSIDTTQDLAGITAGGSVTVGFIYTAN